ncbi:aldolase-type tim barrel [Lucifera butyrica]|uniref:Aldolase-type tim barrel n=1 Tax=Lucifera butyrica TaxID=1351585 RepID=A0A498R5V9_9FIRM|nr:NADPH dehydrogenase NamA [Lucifera butyrica]VBB06781.1 aldolase-type tim barrel [Lucifera butyrica]
MLFSDFTVRSITLKNRIVMPPMCMYSAADDGKATDWHFTHYATRAVGRTGLIIVEATGIEPGGRISANDLGIWQDDQLAGLQRIVELVHKNEGKVAIQLNHAGRKSEVPGLEPVAPSAIPFSEKSPVPHTLTLDEIRQVVEHFRQAAKRAVRAGFDAIEIHGAHGYLLNQFLSPLANRRQDEYGGTPANRVRLLGEVVEAVRAEMPVSMPLFVRVSAHEYDCAGNTPETVADMLNLVKDKGIDLVHVSSGAVTPVAPRAYPGYQIGFALTVKENTGLPVIGGGLVTEPLQTEQIIKAGVDLVFLGRELLRNPYWPLQAAERLDGSVNWPEPYLRAR